VPERAATGDDRRLIPIGRESTRLAACIGTVRAVAPSSAAMPRVRFPYVLPRTAFSPRDAARAGDIWRAFQDVAVEAATKRGWSPLAMRDVGSIWIVRSMTVVHHRETRFGEPLDGESWVRRTRRGTFSTREVRLALDDGPIASGTQEWAHLGLGGPCRMPSAMEDDLGVLDEGGIELPDVEPRVGESFEFGFDVWETWMDPVGHVNHPHYIDFCDENVSRRMRDAGLDPLDLVPIAESATFRAQVVAREQARVSSRAVGVTSSGAVVFDHRIATETNERNTDARTIRTHRADPAAFRRAMGID